MLAIAPGWELEVRRGPGWLLVRIRSCGQQASDNPPLADQLWSLLEQHFVYRLVLDLDQLELLDSYLLGQLVLLDRRIRDRGGLMRLCGLSRYNREILHLHGLDARFPAYGDSTEAVMGYRRKPR